MRRWWYRGHSGCFKNMPRTISVQESTIATIVASWKVKVLCIAEKKHTLSYVKVTEVSNESQGHLMTMSAQRISWGQLLCKVAAINYFRTTHFNVSCWQTDGWSDKQKFEHLYHTLLVTGLTKTIFWGTNQYGVFGLILYVPVNSYGHVGTVSSPNHTLFSWASLTKQ